MRGRAGKLVRRPLLNRLLAQRLLAQRPLLDWPLLRLAATWGIISVSPV